VLYWHSRLETKFAEQPPRATLLSPFGTTVGYDYKQPDARDWQRQPGLLKDRDGRWQLPARVILRFEHGTMSEETIIVLPVPSAGLPAF